MQRSLFLAAFVLFMLSCSAYAKALTTIANAMSSEDFKGMVNSMGQQSKSDLKNQLNQSLTNKMPVPPPDQSDSSSQPSYKQASPKTNSASSAQPASTPMQKPTRQPSQDTYTGFGSDSSKPQLPSGNNSEGGWNVNY